ncbi:hypothetical protein Tco_0863767 [Tanacetum coccineum]
MMASTDEDVEKSSLVDQVDIRVTPSSRSSKSGDHQRSRCNKLEYDRHDGRVVLRKYSDIDLLTFIHVADPTKVKIVERELVEGEVKLLDSIVGCVVPLLPFVPARAESKLEASVKKLFDEGGSTEQGDSAAGGGHDAEIELVMDLLASCIPSAKASVLAIPTLPFVTSSVSATLESEGGAPLDSVTRANLRTIGPPVRFVISLDSSHHSSTNASGAVVDYVISSGDTIKPDAAGPSHPPGKELSLGSREVDYENHHEVFIPH